MPREDEQLQANAQTQTPETRGYKWIEPRPENPLIIKR